MEESLLQQQRIEALISRVRWQNAVFTSLQRDSLYLHQSSRHP